MLLLGLRFVKPPGTFRVPAPAVNRDSRCYLYPCLQMASATELKPKVLSHLERLEAESIHIMREVVAEARNPVMLYSLGKDSSVMLHLARKAFFPGVPPFPLLHVDTTWKFREMYAFRD